MLRLLRIKNFAIIDALELEFHAGLNAITGETGAGKSIVLDAIGLILGNRATAELIRTGSEEATVEALFDVGRSESFEKKLQAHGLDTHRADHEIIVKRAIHRSGKNKIFLNGELITLSQLADICENLVDLCSQHEHQSLSKPIFQLDLLDRYGGLIEKKRAVRELYSALRSCESELRILGGDERERARNEDFVRFQLNELEEFDPKEGEEEALTNERRKLLNATNLIESVDHALALLGTPGSSEEHDARTLLTRAAQKLSKSTQIDSSLSGVIEAIGRAQLEVEEATSQLASYASNLEIDPQRLETIEERLSRWSEIKRKYGMTFEDIVQTRSRLEQEFSELAHRQSKIADLELKRTSLKKSFQEAALELSKKRKNIAKTLKTSIQSELRELMMPGTSFDIEFTQLESEQWGPEGVDRIQFLFSPNPGEGLKPVAKIASGGEMSRVMLAIRRTMADRGGIGVYLFDEIDSGIGGQTATIVGRKLQSVAQFNQVICITHLPQVAAFAGAHYSVSKKVVSGRTSSQVALLEGQKRVDELARMLGGLNVTEKSRAHAKDLIKQAHASSQ
ncbi:MAG: DNA repair protein RecN [Bdellovibrionota bacterium]